MFFAYTLLPCSLARIMFAVCVMSVPSMPITRGQGWSERRKSGSQPAPDAAGAPRCFPPENGSSRILVVNELSFSLLTQFVRPACNLFYSGGLRYRLVACRKETERTFHRRRKSHENQTATRHDTGWRGHCRVCPVTKQTKCR